MTPARRSLASALLALCGLLLAASPMAAQDLPPKGTASLFDRLIQASGGVPFPFERLAAAVAAAGDPGDPPVPLLIPDGRSLVREETSFARPRILLAARGEPPGEDAAPALPLLKNRLFIGYAEAIAQLEVISYNPGAGRFEFQLVDDYREGAEPRVTYARRALCAGCHQGEAPIFPVRPWQESNARGAIAEAIRAARGAGANESYHGAPLRVRLKDAEAFDSAVAAANGLIAAQAVWRQGCGGSEPPNRDPRGAECRRLLLAAALDFALAPGLFDPAAPEVERLLALQAGLWPAGGLVLPSGELLDRDPLAGRDRGWLGGLLDSVGMGGESGELPPELDPRRPRPPGTLLAAPTPEAVYAVAALFGDGDRRRLGEAAGGDRARLSQAVAGLEPAALFEDGSLERGVLVAGLLDALGAKGAARPCCASDEGMPEPTMAVVAPLALAPGSELVPFQRYCAGCHRGNSKPRLDFMRGDSEAEVWANLLVAQRLAEVLDWERYRDTPRERELMPPWNSREAERLEAAIAAGDDALGAMRRALSARGVMAR